MPIFMDRHIVPGITLKDATEAHNLDVAIQDDFDCKAITFWLDEDRGCAFCLIEAPNEQAVRELHNEAHGLIPHEIIEVDESLVMAFLGRINEPELDLGNIPDGNTVFYDPAYRAILVTQLAEAALIPSKFGKREGRELFNAYGKIIENAFKTFQGREVHHSGDGYMASFASVSDAVNCASNIQNKFSSLNSHSKSKLHAAIGISGGDPVTGKNALFGEAIELARRLCYLSADRGEILVSSEVTERFGTNRLRILAESTTVETLSTAEEHFLNRLMDVVEEVWQRPGYTLEDICKEVGISRSQLYRNITSLTGQSFVDFVKEFRLKRALDLIERDMDSITQIAYSTGFNNPSYFSKCFKERYGMLPSEFAKTVR